MKKKKRNKVKDVFELMTDGTAERERIKRGFEEEEESSEAVESVSEDIWGYYEEDED